MEDRESEDSLALLFDRRSDQKTPDQGRPVTYQPNPSSLASLSLFS